MKPIKEDYFLGNLLRGFVNGSFSSAETAWNSLTKEFEKRFPSEGGREVYMYKEVSIKVGGTKEKFDE
jgi:hypothetical protein